MIAKFPKPPKDSGKRRKSEKSKEKSNRAYDNSDDDNDLKVSPYGLEHVYVPYKPCVSG